MTGSRRTAGSRSSEPQTTGPGSAARRPLFAALAAEIAPRLDGDPVHDVHHARRVCRLGVHVAEAEGADAEVVGAAAIVHDLHRVRDGDAFVHPRETIPEVESILAAAGFPQEKVAAVCHCVAVHEEYAFEADPEAAETIEAEVLQDADNLDAIGAVGLARAFAYSGAHGNPLWRPDRDDEPVGAYEKLGPADDASTIRHVREKLLRLRETMSTETGREMAAARHAFLESFGERFERNV